MDLTTTVIALCGFLAVALFAGWRGARPADFRRGPRMIPWRMIMLLAGAGALFLLVHIANLMGVRTGR